MTKLIRVDAEAEEEIHRRSFHWLASSALCGQQVSLDMRSRSMLERTRSRLAAVSTGSAGAAA
jgi:hypothetical protein